MIWGRANLGGGGGGGGARRLGQLCGDTRTSCDGLVGKLSREFNWKRVSESLLAILRGFILRENELELPRSEPVLIESNGSERY